MSTKEHQDTPIDPEREYVQGRTVSVIEREDLEALPTHRLLARLQSLRECVDALECSDYCPRAVEESDGILFKSSPEWETAYLQVKEVLATREHLLRSSQESRRASAKQAAHGDRRQRTTRRKSH